MRQPTRVLGGVLAVAGIGLLSGCFLLPQSTIEHDSVVDETIESVLIDSESGSITIEGDDDLGEVTVHRTFRYRGVAPTMDTYRVEDGALVLGGCGRNCSVSYVVEVPEGIPVSGETTNGEITLESVGQVDVRTSNGRIQLDDINGDISARTSNGRIDGNDLRGDQVDVESSNGSIDLSLGSPQDVRASTSNGSITLHLPDGSYDVSAETSNGRTDIDVPTDPDGRYSVELRTSNGSITVDDE